MSSAVRVLRDPYRHPALASWCRDAAARLGDVDLAPLNAIMARHYTPDFISPGVNAGTVAIDDQLMQVRTTAVEIVATELARTGEWHPAGGDTALSDLQADPAKARHVLADLLAEAWHRLIEPEWQRIGDLLEADIAFRSRQLAQHGLEGVLADMHPAIRWSAPTISVDAPIHASASLDGRGLVMQPSVFLGPNPALTLDEPWQPTLVYPARGTATLGFATHTPAAQPLARLLGATRARLLVDLAEPLSTTVLALRHRIAASTVSAHLAALRDAGLATGRRMGHSVVYAQTALGVALVYGRAP